MDKKKPHFMLRWTITTKKTPNVPVILSEKLEPVYSTSEGKKSDNANAGKRLDFLSKSIPKIVN